MEQPVSAGIVWQQKKAVKNRGGQNSRRQVNRRQVRLEASWIGGKTVAGGQGSGWKQSGKKHRQIRLETIAGNNRMAG